jgi:hypothetical protein
LQSLQAGSGRGAQVIEIQAEVNGSEAPQAAQAFTEQHGGTPLIAALEMVVGHGDLKDALQHAARGALGFMPELLEAIVAGIPGTGIELGDSGLKAGVRRETGLFGIAQWIHAAISAWRAS